jgi:hypothetical protein
MADDKDLCVRPARGPILDGAHDRKDPSSVSRMVEEIPKMLASVGKMAPDFEASAFVDGGFKNVRLSDYRGQWVVLCFYPGDFTFV